MIELTDVRKRYGRTRRREGEPEALRGVTLSLKRGAVTAIVGPNGAGKTTLFGIALGFLTPSSGDATISGQDPRDWTSAHGAGWLPERFAPPPAWRVGECVAGLARLDGLGRNSVPRTREALDRLGLSEHTGRPIGVLSRGLIQRVGLAQALVARHPLIVLDEPTGGLDPDGRAAFRDMLAELRELDVTVLLASHDIAEIERIADTVVLLQDGRVREILAARSPADYSRFRLRLVAPEPVLRSAFPDAVRAYDGSQTTQPADTAEEQSSRMTEGQGGERSSWLVVNVPDVVELNRRIALLIAAGGIVYEIEPFTDALESRLSRLGAVDNAGKKAGSDPT